ncbi:hypothetical protein SISNIDRAFT_470317 [Sistotremastrum niveocremeum HHB9708]|uniref:Fungal-type protein kinase domain-containing protein n=1 Tax=Sistotremastrum niveocremeum HHB9708 TaxID=1314777 RepID=A0A164P3L8_9AGAM|nr:hypothetical protein SISNIDRAFT_470317 [Sistotremastrum niveocremeum HHB9708]
MYHKFLFISYILDLWLVFSPSSICQRRAFTLAWSGFLICSPIRGSCQSRFASSRVVRCAGGLSAVLWLHGAESSYPPSLTMTTRIAHIAERLCVSALRLFAARYAEVPELECVVYLDDGQWVYMSDPVDANASGPSYVTGFRSPYFDDGV